jgi:toxin-antitoxin system PIN domain toxin
MSKSMRLHFPDVNVWLALHYEFHPHHRAAKAWFENPDQQSVLIFCRQTQLGMFRLLSTESVMGTEALSQRQCWTLYERWIESGRAELWSEPAGLEGTFQRDSNTEEQSPKRWTDAYLGAFAEAAELTLVTFDRALAGKTKGAVLLS